MKTALLLSFFTLAIGNITIAQTKAISKSIISPTASVKKFHEKIELDDMNKGQLVDLYIERIQVLVKKIPFIAITNKRGVTIQDVGIPNSPENNKVLEKQHQTISTFLSETETFERTLTPFADKGEIVESILFLESILKELRIIRD